MTEFLHFLIQLLTLIHPPVEIPEYAILEHPAVLIEEYAPEQPPAPVSSPIRTEKSDLWNEGCAAGTADFAVGFKSELDDSEWSIGYQECWK